MVLCQLLGPALRAGWDPPGGEANDSQSWSLSVGTRRFPRQTPVQEQDSGIPLPERQTEGQRQGCSSEGAWTAAALVSLALSTHAGHT